MARIFNAVRAENTPPRHARGDFKQALKHYNIDPAKVYANGYSDGGLFASDEKL